MYRQIFAALWMPNRSLAPCIASRFPSGSKIKKAGAGFAVALLSMAFLHSAAFAQSHPINTSIDVSKTGTPISKNIYGQFLEHGGDIVNTGIWSEMLADRKFFYPVDTAAPTPPPVMGNPVGNPRLHLPPARWWAPIGGAGLVIMDARLPYSGDQSPLVKLDPKDRTASVNRESPFGKERVTPAALCLRAIRRT